MAKMVERHNQRGVTLLFVVPTQSWGHFCRSCVRWKGRPTWRYSRIQAFLSHWYSMGRAGCRRPDIIERSLCRSLCPEIITYCV